MSTLVLDLSKTQLDKLERLAEQRGTSVDALMHEILDEFAARSADEITHDPLYSIKAHETGAPADLSQNVDQYLYGAGKP